MQVFFINILLCNTLALVYVVLEDAALSGSGRAMGAAHYSVFA